MQQGIFEKSITVTPDYCDAAAQLSPLAAFTIFQGIAAQHAELIGVGGAAMAKRGEFWLTVHTRVDFLQRAGLMDELTAATWPEPCDGKAVRCYRSYSLRRGDALLALGRTQWAVLGPEKKLMQFAQTGFPADFPFSDRTGITDHPCIRTRFADDLTQAELVRGYTVRPTDIDFGRHKKQRCLPSAVFRSTAPASPPPAADLSRPRAGLAVDGHRLRHMNRSLCPEGENLAAVYCRRRWRRLPPGHLKGGRRLPPCHQKGGRKGRRARRGEAPLKQQTSTIQAPRSDDRGACRFLILPCRRARCSPRSRCRPLCGKRRARRARDARDA